MAFANRQPMFLIPSRSEVGQKFPIDRAPKMVDGFGFRAKVVPEWCGPDLCQVSGYPNEAEETPEHRHPDWIASALLAAFDRVSTHDRSPGLIASVTTLLSNGVTNLPVGSVAVSIKLFYGPENHYLVYDGCFGHTTNLIFYRHDALIDLFLRFLVARHPETEAARKAHADFRARSGFDPSVRRWPIATYPPADYDYHHEFLKPIDPAPTTMMMLIEALLDGQSWYPAGRWVVYGGLRRYIHTAESTVEVGRAIGDRSAASFLYTVRRTVWAHRKLMEPPVSPASSSVYTARQTRRHWRKIANRRRWRRRHGLDLNRSQPSV